MNRVSSFAVAAVVMGIAGLWACANNGDGATSPEAGSQVDAGDEGVAACNAPQIACGNGECVDPTSDPLNCGGCGAKCASRQVCFQGFCMGSCPLGVACGGTCSMLANDPLNCGHCGVKCDQGLSCIGGSCVCPNNTIRCGNACIDPQVDIDNCGACGNACSSGFVCVAGKCSGCGAAETLCKPSATPVNPNPQPYCVNTKTSPSDCGGCGDECDGGGVCTDGTCGCGPLLTACAGACVDTRFDTGNCGGCGNACDGGQCLDGGCSP